MKIIVTGGAGGAGGYCTRELLGRGHDVRVLDLIEGDNPEADNVVVDLLDLEATTKAVEGFDAIVHLAAIPAPRPREQWPDVWRINVLSTYNVFEAAWRNDVKKVVIASSICACGFCGGWRSNELPYLPIDEEYPIRTQEPYSVSKLANEYTALSFSLSQGISGLCMRLGNIRYAEHSKDGTLSYLACEPNFATITAENVAQGFRRAVESEGIDFGVYNLTNLYRYNKRGEVESPEEVLENIRTKCENTPEIRDPEWVFAGKSSFDLRRTMKDLGYDPQT